MRCTMRFMAIAHCVVAQVEFESEFESNSSYFSFKRLVPGAFNLVLIGSTCTALPLVQVLGLRPGAYTRSLLSST